MTKMNFQDALNTKGGEIEPPKLLPQGTYVMSVSKQPSFAAVGKDGQYETCDFLFRPVAPTDDCDPDEIAAYGDITGATVRHRFMFDTADEAKFNNSMWYLQQFLEHHLLVAGADSNTMKKNLADSLNHQCLATVSWRPNPDNPEIMYAEIKRTAPVE